jgi:hypothetical protein
MCATCSMQALESVLNTDCVMTKRNKNSVRILQHDAKITFFGQYFVIYKYVCLFHSNVSVINYVT